MLVWEDQYIYQTPAAKPNSKVQGLKKIEKNNLPPILSFGMTSGQRSTNIALFEEVNTKIGKRAKTHQVSFEVQDAEDFDIDTCTAPTEHYSDYDDDAVLSDEYNECFDEPLESKLESLEKEIKYIDSKRPTLKSPNSPGILPDRTDIPPIKEQYADYRAFLAEERKKTLAEIREKALERIKRSELIAWLASEKTKAAQESEKAEKAAVEAALKAKNAASLHQKAVLADRQKKVEEWRKKCSWYVRANSRPYFSRGISRIERLPSLEQTEKIIHIHTSLFAELKQKVHNKLKSIGTKVKKFLVRKKRTPHKNSVFRGSRVTSKSANKTAAVISEKQKEREKLRAKWHARNLELQALALLNPKQILTISSIFGCDIEEEKEEADKTELELEEDKKEKQLSEIFTNKLSSFTETPEKLYLPSVPSVPVVQEDEEEDEYFLSAIGKRMGLSIPPPVVTPTKPKSDRVLKKEKKQKALDKVRKLGLSSEFSLIKQRKQELFKSDHVFAARSTAVDELKSPELQKERFAFTSMCKFALDGKKCIHKTCRFAHDPSQLKKRSCAYGIGCAFVIKNETGWYTNAKGKSGVKTCTAYHPEETEDNFKRRLGYKTPTSTPTRSPITTTTLTTPSCSTTTLTTPSCSTTTTTTTKKWADIVKKTLTDDEKKIIYNKGFDMLSKSSLLKISREPEQVSESFRKPGQRYGLGYTGKTSNSSSPISWIKGGILNPKIENTPKRVRKSRWDIEGPVEPDQATIEKALNKAKEISLRLQKDNSTTIENFLDSTDDEEESEADMLATQRNAHVESFLARTLAERLEAERLEAERLEAERVEVERAEVERAERLEAERRTHVEEFLARNRLEAHVESFLARVPTYRVPRDSAERIIQQFMSVGKFNFHIEYI